MKKELERYRNLDDLAKELGLSETDIALMKFKKKVIAKLRKAREEKGLTQAQVAKMMNTKQPAIARMEVGLLSEVSTDFLIKMAWVLEVKLPHLPSHPNKAA